MIRDAVGEGSETVGASIVVERPREPWVVRLVRVHVMVDGRDVGSLPSGLGDSYAVAPGQHSVRVTVGQRSSEERWVTLAPGDSVGAACFFENLRFPKDDVDARQGVLRLEPLDADGSYALTPARRRSEWTFIERLVDHLIVVFALAVLGYFGWRCALATRDARWLVASGTFAVAAICAAVVRYQLVGRGRS